MALQQRKNYCLLVDPVISGASLCEGLAKENIILLAYKSGLFFVEELYEKRFPNYNFEAIFSSMDQDVIGILSQYSSLRVIAGNESSVEITDKLASVLCPQYANSPDTSIYRANKYYMQEALKLADLPAIPQMIIDNENLTQQQQSEIKSWKFPVFIKPTRGGASVGIKRCDDIAEVVSYIKHTINHKNKTLQEVVIQKYITGEEYFVDTVSLEATHKVSSVFKYKKFLFQGVPTYRYLEIVDPYSDEGIVSIKFVKSVLDTLGLFNGPGHTEIFLTKDGPYLIELNPRVSGVYGLANKLATIATGLNQYALLADSINNPGAFVTAYNLPAQLKLRGRILLLNSWVSKKFVKFNDSDLQDLPSFVEYLCLLSEGDQLAPPCNLSDTIAFVLLVHESIEQIEEDSKRIFELEKQGVLF